MKRQRALMIAAMGLAVLLAAPAALADTYTFSLLPASGNVVGPPGSTVGWGYSITNTSASDWLVTTGLGSDPFLNGTPNTIFDFPDLGPGVTITIPFDPAAPAGLFELTWYASAPVGFANSGNFDLSAEFWSGDPLAGGAFVASAPDTLAAYTATVSAPAPVPEPATALLLLSGLGLWRRRLKHSFVRTPVG